jgi:alcohol dehydrogenase (NADP+)
LGSGDQFSVNGLNRKRSGPAPIAHTAVVDAAKDTGMTPSQVLLAWNVTRGNVCVIPKSVTPARQRENLDAVANGRRLPKEHFDAVGSFAEQYRLQHGAFHTGPHKPYKTLADLWDEDVGYMEGRDFEQPEGFALR